MVRDRMENLGGEFFKGIIKGIIIEIIKVNRDLMYKFMRLFMRVIVREFKKGVF